MNLLRRTLVACLLAGVSGVAVAAGSRPLQEPEPAAIPAGMAPAAVAKAIKRALLARNWAIGNEKPGYMEGTLNVRKHMVKVGLKYDGKRVTMSYLDSAELGYTERDGQPYIHPSYTKWTRNLMNDVDKFLQNPDL
ncbi:MAG: hypothetical protein ACT4PK_06840 [Gammaproteobacteria bacterium]